MLLKSLRIANFTAFAEAELEFSPGLNVFVGENGTGKTHLLKLPYAVLRIGAEECVNNNVRNPTKALAQRRIAEKLFGVMRPDALGRLAKRQPGRQRCEVGIRLTSRGGRRESIAFHFATRSKSEVTVDCLPPKWWNVGPVFLPTRDLLAIYPGFLAFFETYRTEFEETWRDTCQLLSALEVKQRAEGAVALLARLEEAMGGKLELDRKTDRFYLRRRGGERLEMHMVAEGSRKVGMLAHLVATGVLARGTTLFWDEPEGNLNAKLVRSVARAILDVCNLGVQVFIATHSLFLLREIEMLTDTTHADLKQRYFALQHTDDGVAVHQGGDIADVDPLVLLDEELEQSDRYLEAYNSL